MRFHQLLLILFTILCQLFSACSHEALISSSATCNLENDTVSFNNANTLFGHYEVFCQAMIDEEEVIVGYNEYKNGIEIFSLSAAAVRENLFINLNTIDSKGIENVRGIAYVNPDTIFIGTLKHIFHITQSGELKNKIWINQPRSKITGINFDEKLFDFRLPRNRLFFDSEEQKFYFYTRWGDRSQFENAYYEGSICGTLSLNDLSFEPLPIYYPDLFQNSFYGFLNRPYFLYEDNRIIYSFENHAAFYVYDKISTEVKAINWQPQNTNSKAKTFTGDPEDYNQILRHVDFNPGFLALTPNADKSMYYQFFFAGRQDGEFGRGKLFLAMFNKNLTQISESDVPSKYYPFLPFSINDNIYVKDMEWSTDNKISFHKLKFNCQ